MGEFTDKAKGAVNKVIGQAKQNSDNPHVRSDGASQEAKGDVQNLKGKVKAVVNKL